MKFLLVYALVILDNITVALTPILFGWFVDSLQTEGRVRLDDVFLYVGGYMGLKFVYWIFHAPARVLEHKLAFKISSNFLISLYHKVLFLRFEWHQSHHSGATISRIQKSSKALSEFLQNNSICTSEIAKFIFAIIAITWFSPIFGIICFVLGVLTIWVILKLDKPFISAIHEMNEREHDVSSSLFDSLSNIVTVISLRLQGRMEGSLKGKFIEMFPTVMKQIKYYEIKWCTSDVLTALIYSVVVVGFVLQNQKSEVPFPLGNFVALIGFVIQFTGVFQVMASYYTTIVQYATDIRSSQDIIQSYYNQNSVREVLELSDWHTIVINSLNFTHIKTSSSLQPKQSIYDISMVFEKGQKIAILGESGSGKSTLLALIRGLYDAGPGVEVIVDGISEIPLAALEKAVTLFPQDYEIFESSIEHNITLGLPTEKSAVFAACEVVHLIDFLGELPNGIHSLINEKGINLSGGQKQRLALARGILAAKESSIILLDEPTSSLDIKTEQYVFSQILDHFSDKTVIASFHRSYLLKFFDYIYILERGRILDEGTFDDLHLRSDYFKSLLIDSEFQKDG